MATENAIQCQDVCSSAAACGASVMAALHTPQGRQRAGSSGAREPVIEFKSEVSERGGQGHESSDEQIEWNVRPRWAFRNHARVDNPQPFPAKANRGADLRKMLIRGLESRTRRLALYLRAL